MPIHYRTAKGLVGARVNLSRFVQHQAEQAAETLGFDWTGTSDAPSTYPQLRAAFAHSTKTGTPLPVSNDHCEDTVFLEPSGNVAFRFWHDTSHCRLGLSFSMPDEWELALWHLDHLVEAGFEQSSLEYRLLQLDLFGQIILLGIAGRFPFNQGEFTRRCAELGMEAGIMAELERLP